MTPLDGQQTKLVSKSIPTIETPEIEVDNLELLEILEGEEWYGCLEWKLFVSLNERSPVIGSQS